MTKAPTQKENPQKQRDNTQTSPKNLDYTTIADRLRTLLLEFYRALQKKISLCAVWLTKSSNNKWIAKGC